MTNALRPRIRKHAPKTRSGCKTCKKRRVKCDERKPICVRCEKLSLKCEGYEVPKAWLFEPRSSSSDPDENDESSSDAAGNSNSKPKETFMPCNPHHEVIRRQGLVTERPHMLAIFSIKDSEDLFLMSTYVQFAARCPVAWESDLYGQKHGPSGMTNQDIIGLHANSPVTRLAHLAMATATLHLFQPQIFSSQLQLKYLQLAIAEVRKRIIKHTYEMSDLLHGISQIFLASVLIGDDVAARAHLSAAKELVDQQGGIDACCTPTAQALKYGDLHLAVETVSPPVFLAVPDPEIHYDKGEIPDLDGTLLSRSKDVRISAILHRESLSESLVRCYCTFAECVVALCHAWQEGPGQLDLNKLDWIASNCLGIFNIVLRLGRASGVVLTTVQEDSRHMFVLWIQLLCFLANSSISGVDVRSNTILISPKVLSRPISPAVRYGLTKWNLLVDSAKKDSRSRVDTTNEDIMQLIQVVEEMEAKHCVQMAPLMHKIWEIRAEYKRFVMSPRNFVDAMQSPELGTIYEVDPSDPILSLGESTPISV